MLDIFTARAINRALGTAIGPWDVGQIDEASIGAILQLLKPAPRPLEDAPAIARRKQEIRSDYWRRVGQAPPRYR